MTTHRTEDELLGNLAEVVALLERVSERHWSTWLRTDLARLERGDSHGLDHLLMAYGGAGSLNDLTLSPHNGHTLKASEVPSVNEELRVHLRAIYAAAMTLRRPAHAEGAASTIQVSPRLRRRIEHDFVAGDAAEVCRAVADASGSERIQAAIVLAARGKLEWIRGGVELAALDWRDVLVNGGVASGDWERTLNTELGPPEV